MRYKHDCPECRPLGEYGDADLYFCKNNNLFVARYGDKGRDYQSGFQFADKIPHLREAKKRAIEFGYLPKEPDKAA